MSKQFPEAGRKPRVCIIGAGAAGLRAAHTLLQHEVQVTILEARDRIGGRLTQSTKLGYLMDLGPNWLQIGNQDPVLKLARDTDTPVHSFSDNQVIFDEDGNRLPHSEVIELQEIFWEMAENAFQHSNDNSDCIEPGESLLDFVRKETLHRFQDKPADAACRKRKLLLQVADMWGTFVGNPIEMQSLKFAWLEASVEGEELFAAGTFAKILSKIAAAAVQGSNIRYQQNVTQIVSREDRTVEIDIEGQPSETFDGVIVTVPLGCLKAGQPHFVPPLPLRLSQAITSIGYGNLDKVYITFPAAFWQESADTNAVPGIISWLAPSYASPSNPKRWLQVCINLAVLPGPYGHPTLLFYLFGPCALHIANMVSTTAPDRLEDVLFNFFLSYVSRLPGYSSENPACKPVGILASAWANDKYAGHGSYCNFPIGLEQGAKDIECIREGLPERHVWLAGEHTAPFDLLGTVTGAYVAGEEVAARVLQSLHMNFS